jgi:hypothetical protein
VGEPKQRDAQEQRGYKKQNARAVDMLQAKELAREKGGKQERSAHPATERQLMPSFSSRARRMSGSGIELLPTTAPSSSERAVALISAWTAASRDIIRDTKAATAPRKNDGATAFEKICVSLSMSGTNSMLQPLHHRLWFKSRFLRFLRYLSGARADA